jgi:hypothetical protein
LPHPPVLHVYAGFADRIFCGDMTNTHKMRRNFSADILKWQLKHLVVLPLASRIDWQEAAWRKLERSVFKRIQEVDDSIEIIAREMARQSKRGN